MLQQVAIDDCLEQHRLTLQQKVAKTAKKVQELAETVDALTAI